MPKAKPRLTYAIDFGTSNSLLCAATPDETLDPIPLDPDAADPSVFRTLIYFASANEAHYGAKAIQEFIARDLQGRLIRSVKKFLPMRTFIGTWVDNRPLNLEDIIALFLKQMRERANRHFDQDVDSAVIGRPARFAEDDADDSYAQYRLERAARQAGFKHIEFCAEPIAASFAFRSQLTEPKTVLVADFGGGTSDFTVMRLSQEPFNPKDVLSIGGVSVAGDALDGAVMRTRISPHFGADVSYKVPFGSNVLKMPRDLMEKICSPADVTVLRKQDTMEFFKNVRQWSLGAKDREKVDRLFCLIEDQLGFQIFERIEATKRELSSAKAADFTFDYPGIELKDRITRKEFDELIESQVARITRCLDETLKAAGLTASEIDVVCCTGGTAKVPLLAEELARRFGADKIQQYNPFHSVVKGLGEKARGLFA